MNGFEITKYAVKPLIGAGLIYFYNVAIENKSFSSKSALSDVYVMAGSILTSDIIFDVIDNYVGFEESSLLKKIFPPLLNAFIYSYAFEKYVIANNQDRVLNRNSIYNYLIGCLIDLLSSYSTNPLTSLFFGVRIY